MQQSRKILWILGAGASLGAGAYTTVQNGGKIPIPTQKDFWPTLLKFSSTKKRKTLEKFLFRYFTSYSQPPARFDSGQRAHLLKAINVEEVFTFVSERIQSPSTSASLQTYLKNEIWPLLMSQVGETFRKYDANSGTRKVYKKLKERIGAHDAIISFNYDTVLENSIAHNSWHYFGSDSRTGIPILKPHGSVNWSIQNNKIMYKEGAASVIVAPSHLKFVKDGDTIDTSAGYLTLPVAAIWTEMERQMKIAKAFVFIGYSFPVADLYFSSVLRSVLATRDAAPKFVIVNPDSVAIAERLEARFALKNIIKNFELKSFIELERNNMISNA